MSKIEVVDSLIWSNHISDDVDLADAITRMGEGEMIELEVDGYTGVWQKVSDNRETGDPVNAIKPLFSAKMSWAALERNQSVDVRMTRVKQ